MIRRGQYWVVCFVLTACGGSPVETDSDASETTGTQTSSTTGVTPTTVTGEPTIDSTQGPTTDGTTVDPTTADPSETQTSDTTEGESETTGTIETACTRAGGAEGLAQLSALFHNRLLVDDRINAYFLTTHFDNARFTECMADFFGQALECPDIVYNCKDPQTLHAGFGISTADFDDFRSDMLDAVEAHRDGMAPDLSQADVEILLAAVDETYSGIVEDETGEGTLYQRLGRKPAIRDFVGGVDDPTSWLGKISADPTISGFFQQSDPLRFQTCLIRQLVSLDGPEIYGDEVDAPEGVDPGVSANTPCREMLAAHSGVINADTSSPINVADFSEFIFHLIDAMDAHQVAPADQEILVGAFEQMCGAIVGDNPNDCPGSVQTVIVEEDELGLTIPGTYNGSLDSMVCIDLPIYDDGFNFVEEVEVEIGMNNTWLSDLTMKLVNPEGMVVTLVSRPGLDESADDGVEVGGENTDLLWTHPIVFAQDAEADAEAMGAMLNSSEVVCRDDNICSYKPNSGAALAGDLSSLVGQQAPGNWQVCVGDASGTDGPLDYVGLKVRKAKYSP